MPSEKFIVEANAENRWLPLALVTITHKLLDTPICCTPNGEDVISSGITYRSFPFGFEPPKRTREGIEPGKLIISNITGEVVEACRKIAGNTYPAQCTFKFVMPENPDVVECIWPGLDLRDVTYSDSLSGSLCHPMFDTEPYTKISASDAYFPGL